MGTCYTYLLYDEMDWGYRDESRLQIMENLKKDYPVATIEATWNRWMVVDLDKISPYGDNIQRLQKYCDGAYYYADTSIYELKKVQFKQLPEDKIAEANKPANRNAAYIKQANDEWDKRYKHASKP